MERKHRLGTAILLLTFALHFSAPPAAAATANFQGNCTWNATFTQFTCTFDAGRPVANPSACPGSFIWKYRWDFDDGTTSGLTGSTFTKTYPGSADPFVTLVILCWDGNFPELSRGVCSHFGFWGCIPVNGNWN